MSSGTMSERKFLTITRRIQVAFLLFSAISLALSYYTWFHIHKVPGLYWDTFYQIIFPVGVVTCMVMAFRPRIGEGALFLLPIFIGALVLVLDFWLGYFREVRTLSSTVSSSAGWSLLLVAIAYIDLLESRIYHRMVAYFDGQKSN